MDGWIGLSGCGKWMDVESGKWRGSGSHRSKACFVVKRLISDLQAHRSAECLRTAWQTASKQ